MITIIPTFDILKTVTDKNISGDAANYRRIAFDKATELMSVVENLVVLLEGNLYKKVSQRLNSDHKSFFESIYKIDNSAKDVPTYNVKKSVIWVANSESKINNVVIITENIAEYKEGLDKSVCACDPKTFVNKVTLSDYYFKKRMFNTRNDSLIYVFFPINKK